MYGATGSNAHASLQASPPTVSFKCSQSLARGGPPAKPTRRTAPAAYCTLATGCNVVQVSEQASVGTTFLGMFLSRFTTVSATSTASAHGGRERPLDVMVVLDTTGSMRNDAQSAVARRPRPEQARLREGGSADTPRELEPCSTVRAVPRRNALDRVGLMAFPPLVNANLRRRDGWPGHAQPRLLRPDLQRGPLRRHRHDRLDEHGHAYGHDVECSKTISSVSSVTGIQVGSSVSGSGIPSGTTVTAVSSSHSTVTISKSATSSRSHVTLTFSKTTTTSNTSTDPTTSGSYTYTVVPLENSYATRLGGTWQLNTSDPLVAALSTSSSCSLQALSSSDTSFATAIDQAQAALAAENDWSTHDHAIVFLGDGEANYGPIYTSPDDSPVSPYRSTPCQQAAASAAAAAAPTTSTTGTPQAGTTVYAIGYWESTATRTPVATASSAPTAAVAAATTTPATSIQRTASGTSSSSVVTRLPPRGRRIRPAATGSRVRSPAAGRWRTSRATRARSSRTRATPTSRRSSARSRPT